jgi:hypothetical protein
MRKIMALSLFAILTAGINQAETIDHPRNLKEEARVQAKVKQRLMWSTVALLAASFADAHSSWGKRESNPVLRSNNGTFGAKGFAWKMGMVGGIIAAQQIFVHTNPAMGEAMTWTNFGLAGVKASVAARNYRIATPSYLLRQP